MEKKKNEVKAKKKNAKKAVATKIVSKPVKETKVESKEVVKEVRTEKVQTDTKIIKEKVSSKYSLFKILILCILGAAILSWIIVPGTFSGATYTYSSSATRTGIVELFLSVYYGTNYYLGQIFFVLITGLFYGVLCSTNGYKTMVNKAVKFWSNKKVAFVLIHTLILALAASLFNQFIVLLVFIPLICTIAYKLGFNKLTTIAITFGSVMAGLIGQTYSTYGMQYMNSYMNTKVGDGIWIRVGILAIAYLLLNAFVILYLKKNKNNEEVKEDLFGVQDASEKGKVWPYVTIFAILLVCVVLGYFTWTNINVKVFADFHTWLTTKATINNVPVIGYILGNSTAFGSWDVMTLTYVMAIIMIVVKFATHKSWDDMFENGFAGMRKMAKPVMLIAIAYSMFVICYWSGFSTTIVYFINHISTTFNPYLNAIGNAVATFFHVDFGYSAYALSAYYAAAFADNTSNIMAIMISMNGLTAFVAPTSVLMLVGLSMNNVSYKEWIKYIWKYVVAMLVALFIIFTVITYL